MDKGFRVVTRDSSASHEWMKMAAEGSAMEKYYQDYMHDNPKYLVTSGGEVFDAISKDSNLMYWGPDVHMVGKELQYKKYSLEETATSYDGMGIQADSEYAELLNYWLHRYELNIWSTKQQTSRARARHQIICYFVSSHFLCKLST